MLFVAEGFGSGRIRPAPGTWGSLVGLVWTWLLLTPGSLGGYLIGALSGVGAAVWACGVAERLLGKHDPGSVVLDEIVAVPLCFLVPLYLLAVRGAFPGPGVWADARAWWVGLAGFAAFRFFDIAKPWPVRQVQHLPGGWGIVSDDVLAAGWVNVVLWFFVK